MYTVETAIRIALLENTGLDEVAIKSVQAAVLGMVEDPDNIDAPPKLSDAHAKAVTQLVQLDGAYSTLCLVAEVLRVDRALLCAKPPANGIVTIGALPCGPVVGWVIEKVGHPVSFTHYQTVADSQRSMGATVTEHRSRVIK